MGKITLTACSHVPTQTPKFGPISFNVLSMVDRQNGSGTHLAQILVQSIGTMLKLYRSDFKINSMSLRVNKPLTFRCSVSLTKVTNRIEDHKGHMNSPIFEVHSKNKIPVTDLENRNENLEITSNFIKLTVVVDFGVGSREMKDLDTKKAKAIFFCIAVNKVSSLLYE